MWWEHYCLPSRHLCHLLLLLQTLEYVLVTTTSYPLHLLGHVLLLFQTTEYAVVSTTIYPLVIFVVFSTIKLVNHKLHILFDGEELLEEDLGKNESKAEGPGGGRSSGSGCIKENEDEIVCSSASIEQPGG